MIGESPGHKGRRVATTSVTPTARATRARIDLDALAGNVRHLRELAGPAVKVMAVVKANAYGHGAVMVARAAVEAGAAWLGVATVDEGIRLREARLTAPILVLAPASPREVDAAVAAGMTLTAGDATSLRALDSAAGAAGARLPVHLEVDTGLHRYGVPWEEAVAMVETALTLPHLELGGLFTHFATADEADRSFYQEQGQRFREIVAALRVRDLAPPLVHRDNSAASILGRGDEVTMIRAGIALYGLSPSAAVSAPPGLRPVLSIRTEITRVMALRPGDAVSYGREYVADREHRAALTPLGYGDGYLRALSNRGAMLVGGRRARVLGRVCMDQTAIEVPAGIEARVGDEVIVVGEQAGSSLTVDELAALAGTINYEFVTGLSARLPREYWRGGRPVAVEVFGRLSDVDEAAE